MIDKMMNVFGNLGIKTNAQDLEKYAADTTGAKRDILGVAMPQTRQNIIDIIRMAQEYHIGLYPISKGNNWGYGTANPARDGCVIVDLSAMTTISDYDPELGIVTVEPGVTQGQLAEFLLKYGDEYLMPTTGAGPDASILGNALERGYGLVPLADHFFSVMSLEAVLANGMIYRSAIHAKGCTKVDRVFKWGIGPYIDGIFSQSNYGIVTEITIALVPRPEHVETFYFDIASDADLEKTVDLVRQVLIEHGALIGSIKMISSLQLLSMTLPFPFDAVASDPKNFIAYLKNQAKQAGYLPWTCIGSFYGKESIINAAKKALKSRIKPQVNRIIFLTRTKVLMLQTLLKPFGWFIPKALFVQFQKMLIPLDLSEGRPNGGALSLCYRQLRQGVPVEGKLNPARDGCGLLWYAPLVPMKADIVRRYINFVESTCAQYQIEPLITLSSVSEKCFDSTVPILFDLKNSEQTIRAKDCFAALLEGGRRMGVYPYRTGIDMMQDLIHPNNTFWNVQRAIKKALDPNGIMSPGRYSDV